MHHLLEHINQDKATIKTQKCIKLNTGAKETQQVNPGGPDNSQSTRPLDKYLNRNRRRVWGPTDLRAIKEESKIANCDWVDHQACSLSKYINFRAIFYTGCQLKYVIHRDLYWLLSYYMYVATHIDC